MSSRRRFLVGVAATAGAGCVGPLATDDDGRAALPESASVAMACEAREGRYFFSPDLVHVRVGGTVSWTAASTCRQLCTAYHPAYDRPRRVPEGTAPFRGPESRDGTLTHRFQVAGVYDYVGLYEEFGQVGSVVVGWPDPAGEPGVAPPQASIPDDASDALRDLNERTRRLLEE